MEDIKYREVESGAMTSTWHEVEGEPNVLHAQHKTLALHALLIA